MANANAELRRLMQLKKATSAKRINHPLAKYNNLDQLSCIICTKVLKDDSLWNPHLQSKKHKENVALVKGGKSTGNNASQQPLGKSSNYLKPVAKKEGNNAKNKTQLPNDFFDNGANSSSSKTSSSNSKTSTKSQPESLLPLNNSSKPRSILKNPVPAQPTTTTSSNGQPKSILKNSATPIQSKIDTTKTSASPGKINKLNNSVNAETDSLEPSTTTAANSGLPADFFDKGITENDLTTSDTTSETIPHPKETSSVESTENGDNDAAGSSLPEGFFDDPKKDAEARNVEYKDPKESEWESFQKMVQEETKVSEAMQEEDDEESEMLKDLTELNKMKSCLSRVESLKGLISKEKSKKLEMLNNKAEQENGDTDDDSDEEIEALFDWRAKMA